MCANRCVTTQAGLLSYESISAELGSMSMPPTPQQGDSPTARAEDARRETLQEGLFAGLGMVTEDDDWWLHSALHACWKHTILTKALAGSIRY